MPPTHIGGIQGKPMLLGQLLQRIIIPFTLGNIADDCPSEEKFTLIILDPLELIGEPMIPSYPCI